MGLSIRIGYDLDTGDLASVDLAMEASDGIILTTATITFMVGKDITETTTMQVEEVQLTPMITRIGILVLETTTITTKLIEAITVEILIITLLETTTITTK
jgi:hypothetical protein